MTERPLTARLQLHLCRRCRSRHRLRHDDMGCRAQHRQRGYDSEQRKYNKAQSVDHHCRELPVLRYIRGFVFLTQLVCDEPDLLQDHCQFVIGADARVIWYQTFVQSAASITIIFVLSAIQQQTTVHRSSPMISLFNIFHHSRVYIFMWSP